MDRTKFIAEPAKQEIFIIREFNFPKELVFRIFSEPALYKEWLKPRGFEMILKKFEPKNGGSWRYIHKDEEGNEFGFHGVYHEVSPERVIDTFEFEGLPEKGHVSLETARFEELPGGRTRLVVQTVFQSVVDRDGMVGAGMEEGMKEGFERLDELLKKIKK